MISKRPLRIGILGAARIAPTALLNPARRVEGAEVVAVAARDPARARKFASKHGIRRAHENYESLIADSNVDAVYNPLPNSHHCEWTIRALEAGKHVLCEKPLASNAEEAERMADASRTSGRELLEAFHWRYHPLADRMKEVATDGSLGTIEHVEVRMCLPFLVPGDIRYRFDLAGGATMDMGCYTINIMRFLAGSEPEVVGASAKLSSPKVDRAMQADFKFADGSTGRIHCSLCSSALFHLDARVKGTEGELRVLNPVAPHYFHRMSVRRSGGVEREKVPGEPTYVGQLRAFVEHVRGGKPMPSDAADGCANMRVIDSVYEAAGLPRRGA